MCICFAFPSGDSEGKLNELFSLWNIVKFRMKQAVGGCSGHRELVKRAKTLKSGQIWSRARGRRRQLGQKDTLPHLHCGDASGGMVEIPGSL